ncbi:biotin/lipoyl-binding protein [Rudanella paleaurantiibacter]|uniref:Biotin/lipoyl-binding protein n=1 Tax=Rudanella paleaurantiibacter TaxID=2614655 RepID=A0A7J5TZI4_9BACT|nr:efflux RND transporter periplasmic adaptor subunit [Rudanella paleaurantiibacter]KAB7730860.1 biotin/lipoyl-binding protein [Rudanella paleaurantiibacter]
MKPHFLPILTLSTLWLTSCQPDQPRTNELEGKVKKETVGVTAKVPGRITQLLVKEGDVVTKGQILARIDIPEAEAKLLQAQGAFTSAKAQYQMALRGATPNERRQADAALTAAREQADLAEKSFKRVQHMYQDSLISAQQYDEMQAKYGSARAQLNGTQAKRDEVDGRIRAERIRMAYGDMLRAEGALKEVQAAIREKVIVAPQAMTIESISLHEGELAPAGYTVMTGYDNTRTYLRFTVSEKEVGPFKKGEVYTVRLPYAPNQSVTARLVTVKELSAYAARTTSYPTYELGEATYELKLVPTDPSQQDNLLSNQTVLLPRR